MKRHVALTLLLITTLGVIDAHVDLKEVDGRTFVATQGRLYDAASNVLQQRLSLYDALGWLEDQTNSLTRRCDAVQRLDPQDPSALQALAHIKAFSPPHSHSAQAHQVWRSGSWWLVEVSFATLNPAMVLLHGSDHSMAIIESALWSGSTLPWRPGPRIRRHLRTGAPAMPVALAACMAPQAAGFEG